MIKTFLSITSLMFLSLCMYGQDSQNKQLAKKLDDIFSAQFQQTDPGCAVIVGQKGKIVYNKGFGAANIELNVPIRTDMVFNLASITKQFTAVAILQLVEKGKVSLADSIQKFIPDFPSKGAVITIEHLLTHTSGIKDYMQMEFSGVNMERWDFSPKQLIDSFKSRSREFEPGTRFSYSNSGYYLLGYIIEVVSGMSYQDYLTRNIFEPLGMIHSYFDRDGIIIPNRVSGYRKEGAAYRNVDYWSPTIEYAAGGMISNVDDLFKWHRGLYSYQLLKKETLQKAFTSYLLKDGTTTGYGYGWFLKTANGIRSIEHQGGLPGFQTNEVYFPEQDVFIAIFCNSGSAPVDEMSIKLAAAVLNKSLQADMRVDDSILDNYLGVYRMASDTSRTVVISRMNGRIVAEFSKSDILPLLFQTDTKFQFKNLLNADCEFVRKNGVVTKFIVNQNGYYEWVKIK